MILFAYIWIDSLTHGWNMLKPPDLRAGKSPPGPLGREATVASTALERAGWGRAAAKGLARNGRAVGPLRRRPQTFRLQRPMGKANQKWWKGKGSRLTHGGYWRIAKLIQVVYPPNSWGMWSFLLLPLHAAYMVPYKEHRLDQRVRPWTATNLEKDSLGMEKVALATIGTRHNPYWKIATKARLGLQRCNIW